ncbi:MAG TPA: YcxB family protein [candidate division Zixibacteria bacterium]|nr:YcxB family protein [candidate division Zixibacteria bacterium]
MNEKDEVIVGYELIYEDLESVRKEIQKSPALVFLRFVLPITAIVIIEILFILDFSIIGFSTWSIILIICFPLVNLLIVFVIPKALPKILVVSKQIDRLFLESISQYPEGKAIINNYGIQVDLANTTSYNLKWSYLTKIVERELFFYFYYPQFSYLHIPKRAFTQEQIEKLRQLIYNNMEKKKVKIKSKSQGKVKNSG